MEVVLSPLMKGANVVNILILGGLFALGIAAILVVVVLARGEQPQQKVSAKETSVQAPALVEPQSTNVPEVPAASPSQRLTIPLDGENALVKRDERTASVRPISVPLTEFQPFHEVADELRALHQHAWDLERRLSQLSEMIDHIERTQNGQISVEEEQSLPSAQ